MSMHQAVQAREDEVPQAREDEVSQAKEDEVPQAQEDERAPRPMLRLSPLPELLPESGSKEEEALLLSMMSSISIDQEEVKDGGEHAASSGKIQTFQKYDTSAALDGSCLLFTGGNDVDRVSKIQEILDLSAGQTVWVVADDDRQQHLASPGCFIGRTTTRQVRTAITAPRFREFEGYHAAQRREAAAASGGGEGVVKPARQIVVWSSTNSELVPILMELVKNSQHLNLCVICCATKYTNVPFDVRQAADVLVAHHERSQECVATIYHDWASHVPITEFHTLLRTVHLDGGSPASAQHARGDALVYQYSTTRDLFSVWAAAE